MSSIVHNRDVSRIDRKITDRMIAIEPPIKDSVVRLMEGAAVTLMDKSVTEGTAVALLPGSPNAVRLPAIGKLILGTKQQLD